jgi:hypothetical protein
LVTAGGVHKVRPEGCALEPPRETAVFRLWSGEPEEAAEVLLSVPEGLVPRPGRASPTSAMGLPSPAPPATPAQPLTLTYISFG